MIGALRFNPCYGYILFCSILPGQMKNPLEGATSVINGAVNPELAGISGMYYKDCKDSNKTATAK